jgi:hypothetical protein
LNDLWIINNLCYAGNVIFPYAAPSTGIFIGNSPRGAAGMLRVAKGIGNPFWQPLIKMAGRRKQAASGSPFLWILAFGEAKESISLSGART